MFIEIVYNHTKTEKVKYTVIRVKYYIVYGIHFIQILVSCAFCTYPLLWARSDRRGSVYIRAGGRGANNGG